MKPGDDAMTSRVMTVPEVAEFLKVHRTTIYRMVRKGQIPSFKIGNNYRFDRDAIEKWMIDRQVNG